MSETQELHAVVYTDGSARPSRGIGGWGIHGYCYQPGASKVGTGCQKAVLTPTGYHLSVDEKPDITVTSYLDGFGPLIPETTNNVAEITAMTQALTHLYQMPLTSALVLSDSEYVVKGINGLIDQAIARNWRRSDGGPVANQAEWEALVAARDALVNANVALDVQWVKGHAGEKHLGNVIADSHANRGRVWGVNLTETPVREIDTLYPEGRHDLKENAFVEVTPAKGYWTGRTKTDRFIEHPEWFFHSKKPPMRLPDGRWVYYQVNLGEDNDLLHRANPTASYSVVYMEQPVPEMELLRQTMAMADTTYGSVIQANLRVLFSESTLEDIRRTGSLTWTRERDRYRLLTPEGEMLARIVRPPVLVYEGMDALTVLQDTLNEYLNPSPTSHLTITDITDAFLETKGKKQVFLKAHKVGVKSVMVTGRYRKGDETLPFNATLFFGIDFPSRNTLASLAAVSGAPLRISLITWPVSEYAVRYATVVHRGNDVGIWCCPFANLYIHTKPAIA